MRRVSGMWQPSAVGSAAHPDYVSTLDFTYGGSVVAARRPFRSAVPFVFEEMRRVRSVRSSPSRSTSSGAELAERSRKGFGIYIGTSQVPRNPY